LGAVTRESRLGQNEVFFRELNEKLEQRALDRVGGDACFEIVCECDREECTERIAISVAAYEAVRRASADFIVVPGHADASVEWTRARTSRYEVVTKLGEAALVAEAEKPS
jgi:hypothetical protein